MTDHCFLQIFQSSMSVCLIISVFCKSCEPICEPEIVLKKFAADVSWVSLKVSCNFFRTISGSQMGSQIGSQLLQNTEINIVVHWKS